MNFYFNYFSTIGREHINCHLSTVNTLAKSKTFHYLCTINHKECIMSDQSQQPIELHCRAVLHLSPEHFTIRGW